MLTSNHRVEKTLADIVDEHLRSEELFLYSGVIANIELGIQAVEQNDIAEEDHRWWGNLVRDVLRQHAARGVFALNQNYLAALNAVYQQFPQKGRTEANNHAIIRAAGVHQVPFDAEHLIDLVATPEIWSTLHDSRETEDQRRSNNLREQRINEMTSNRTKPFSLRTATGNPRNFDTAGREMQFSGAGGRRYVSGDDGFEGMSNEQLEAIYDQWKQEQTYKSMSTEDLRKTVRQQGKERFEQKFNSDPTTGKPVTSPNAAAVLVDPRNGQAITSRLGLIAYINSSNDALQRLVKPRGTTIRERALAVDALLNQRD